MRFDDERRRREGAPLVPARVRRRFAMPPRRLPSVRKTTTRWRARCGARAWVWRPRTRATSPALIVTASFCKKLTHTRQHCAPSLAPRHEKLLVLAVGSLVARPPTSPPLAGAPTRLACPARSSRPRHRVRSRAPSRGAAGADAGDRRRTSRPRSRRRRRRRRRRTSPPRARTSPSPRRRRSRPRFSPRRPRPGSSPGSSSAACPSSPRRCVGRRSRRRRRTPIDRVVALDPRALSPLRRRRPR